MRDASKRKKRIFSPIIENWNFKIDRKLKENFKIQFWLRINLNTIQNEVASVNFNFVIE